MLQRKKRKNKKNKRTKKRGQQQVDTVMAAAIPTTITNAGGKRRAEPALEPGAKAKVRRR
eukprot:SAG11_NODE_12521_length_699_cov_0.833333_2_plen_59_part_01